MRHRAHPGSHIRENPDFDPAVPRVRPVPRVGQTRVPLALPAVCPPLTLRAGSVEQPQTEREESRRVGLATKAQEAGVAGDGIW